jgi:adenosine kinase
MTNMTNIKKASLICGSMAYDTIMHYNGEFADSLQNYAGTLNASFLVSKMQRNFGGCAGNIAYGLKLLGSNPQIVATMGDDASEYIKYLEVSNISTKYIKFISNILTAQAIITSDIKQNQISTFFMGAMASSHVNDLHIADLAHYQLAIISPDGKEGMLKNIRELNKNNIEVIFDPGQGIHPFSGDELLEMTSMSSYIIVNEYEQQIFIDKTAQDMNYFSSINSLKAFIVTLADKGACIYSAAHPTGKAIAGKKADKIVDPTGCGDAFRAGFIYSLEQGHSIEKAVELGNVMGALKISHQGGQGYILQDIMV